MNNSLLRASIAAVLVLSLPAFADENSEINHILASVFSVVEKDTNKDGRLSSNDKFTISATDAYGKNYKKLFESVEDLIGVKFAQGGSQILIMYEKESRGHLALISVPDLTIVYEKEIPSVGHHENKE